MPKENRIQVKIKIGPDGRENIWAEITKDDYHDIYEPNHHDVKLNCKLLNDPVSIHGAKWGDTVIARTRGEERPIVLFEDNPHIQHDEVTEKRTLKAMYERDWNNEKPE